MDKSKEMYNFVIKVKYGNKLKRIRGHSHEHIMNYNISKIRTEIISLFNFGLNVDLMLTYIDEDGDEVTLDNDRELNDAVLNQQLNPLRINVQSKSDDICVSDSKSEPEIILKLTNLVLRLLTHVSIETVSNSEPFKITEHEAAEMDAIFGTVLGQSSKSGITGEKEASAKNNNEELESFFSTTATSNLINDKGVKTQNLEQMESSMYASRNRQVRTPTESNFQKKPGNIDLNSMFLDSLYLASNHKAINEPIETAPSAPEARISGPLIDMPSSYSMVDALPDETVDDKLYVEQTLLRELENMGFKQIGLNTEILRQNQYDLEQTVDDLCDYSEWGPLLSELRDMGFHDNELNKKMLILNQGSIKQTVMDLVTKKTNF